MSTLAKETDPNYKIDVAEYVKIQTKYQNWVKNINEAKIWEADKIKPFYNGSELVILFGVKPGKITKFLVTNQFEWQLSNPEKTKEDYEKYVIENKDNLLKTFK